MPYINPLTSPASAPRDELSAELEAAIEREDLLDDFAAEHVRATPSLPIILVTAAVGIAGGIVGYFLAYELLGLRIEWSVAMAVLLLCGGVGLSGSLLSMASGSRASITNIAFSCGVIALTLLFFAFCAVVGALAATLLIGGL